MLMGILMICFLGLGIAHVLPDLNVAGNFLKDDTQANTGGENFEEIAGDNNILGEGTDAEKDEQDPQKIMENLRKAGVEFEVAGAPKPEVEQLNQEVQIQEISNHAEEQMQETKAELPKAVDDQKERELLQHAEKLLQEAEELTKNIDVQDGPVDTTTVTDMPSEAVTQAQLEVKADVIVETTIRKEEAVPDVASESVKVPIEVKESTSTTPALQVESSTKLQRHRKIANKIVAHKFDSRGESISEGDEGHHDKNCSQHAKNKGKNVAEKEKPARKRLVHGKKLESPETEVTEVDSKNQPSSESHGNSWSDEFFADDGIPVITIPLGDILRKYQRQLDRENSDYEPESSDMSHIQVKEWKKDKKGQKTEHVHFENDSNEL